MKKHALVNAAFLTAFFSFTFSDNQEKISAADELKIYKARNAIACTPDRIQLAFLLANEPEIPLMPGSGSYVWKIATSSDSAQFYFNQGINTYYGFHIIESQASFRKAARFDPGNPMIWWAQALAAGPNINDVGYTASSEALAAAKKALDLAGQASQVEKDLISAMTVRYSNDSLQSRDSLNRAYTDAMKQVYEKHPRHADVMALYADAMMLLHPWDLWNVNGTPKPWTPLIQEVLEKTLAIAPLHPGANHYYIHVIEPSPFPQKALASADVLGKITPGLAHLVHMPSHIYLHTGQYNKGAAINGDAVNRYKEYTTLFPAVSNGAFIYLLHNQHMLANCAMHAGKYQVSLKAAHDVQQAIDSATLSTPPPMGSLVQYIYMTPVLVNTRFEKWDSLLQMPRPDKQYVYANILYHFGRGMAYAGKNDVGSAKKESATMKELMKDTSLNIPMTPFSAAIDGANTAHALLSGFISLKENKTAEAIAHFQKASDTEEKMVYNEPRDWFLNPKQYLGSAYLKSGNYEKAHEVFRKDMLMNANNIWSLNRLSGIAGRKNSKEALNLKTEFNKAASQSDVDFAGFYF